MPAQVQSKSRLGAQRERMNACGIDAISWHARVRAGSGMSIETASKPAHPARRDAGTPLLRGARLSGVGAASDVGVWGLEMRRLAVCRRVQV